MNIHAPERQPDELFSVYQERRATSKAIHKESQRGKRVDAYAAQTIYVIRHHASPERKERRAGVRMLGARQYKKLIKSLKRAAV